ncbi:flagella basal body P-ring formation protein FlgA [Croceibacterium sp. TMG7-5b_MA50]|uniref:flagella basal body P-ring formation protein FlgA n=1 Tax=Croceibacterium sp. TMG7-5b_MA50 TaxID=3121290 RepID=UPI00322165D4
MRIPAFAAALLLSAPAVANSITEPAAIDQAIAQFTGHAVGQVGGARQPVDARLRLAACVQPLAVEWYGPAQNTVLVRCPVAGWRLFVPLSAPAQAATPARTEPAVLRGETVTVALRGRGFALQRQAEVLEPGAVGEWIRVRSGGRDAQPLRARVIRPGLVGMEMP